MLANLAVVDHKGIQTKSVYPAWAKGALQERLRSVHPFQTARTLAERMFQMPVSNGSLSAMMKIDQED